MKLKEITQSIIAQSKIIEPNSKLFIAFKNHNHKKYSKLLDKDNGYNEKINDKKLELALVGENKEVLYTTVKGDKGEPVTQYLFDKEGTKKLQDFVKSLDDEEAEFEFYKTDYEQLAQGEKNKLIHLDDEEYEIVSRFINDIPRNY